MTAGVEAYAPDGTLIFSITDKVGKVLGYLDTGTSNGSLNVPALSGKRSFYIKSQSAFAGVNYGQRTCRVTISPSGLISWTFGVSGSTNNISSRLIYGYY